MITSRLLERSAAAAFVLVLPTMASAQTIAYNTSPVSVTSCSVAASYAPALVSQSNPQGFLPSNDIALSFVNRANVRASVVKVLVSDGRSTNTIVDAGSFAPGVRIDHTFAADPGLGEGQYTTCSVAEVDFADGATWHAGDHDVAAR